jgi:hypothetical protein
MRALWVDYVADLTASVAMKALPGNIRDLYYNVDLESKVSVGRYRRRLNHSSSKINFFIKEAR